MTETTEPTPEPTPEPTNGGDEAAQEEYRDTGDEAMPDTQAPEWHTITEPEGE